MSNLIEIYNREEIFFFGDTEIKFENAILTLIKLPSRKYFIHTGNQVLPIMINGTKFFGFCKNSKSDEPAQFEMLDREQRIKDSIL